MIDINDIVDSQLWWKIQYVRIFSNFVKDTIRAIYYWQELVMLAFEAFFIQVQLDFISRLKGQELPLFVMTLLGLILSYFECCCDCSVAL